MADQGCCIAEIIAAQRLWTNATVVDVRFTQLGDQRRPLNKHLLEATVAPRNGSCSAKLTEGNDKKYYLHLLQPDKLHQRDMKAKKAQLISAPTPYWS